MATTADGLKLIDLVPAKELAFEYTSASTCEHKRVITNIHDGDIAFRVKTTSAGNAYLVNPANGLLEKGKSAEIQIMLRQDILRKLGGGRSPHEFLIQAALPSFSGSKLSQAEWNVLRKVGIFQFFIRIVNENTHYHHDLTRLEYHCFHCWNQNQSLV